MASVLVLVRDLMFSSKITAAARQLNVSVQIIRDPAALADKDGHRLIVDLNQAGTIDAAVAWKSAGDRRETIGFVSHVDAATIAAARTAGIDRVMARSQFTANVDALLTECSDSVGTT